MKARDMMTSGVLTCRPHDPLSDAAKIMWEHDCGVVPVVDETGRLVGVVTDRDACMAAYTQGKALTELTVASAMCESPQCCRDDEDLSDVESTMALHQVRRVPVVDAENRVVGILSINDLAVHALQSQDPREKIALAETLGQISLHRPLPTN
jgi:CBS domain-containing protein